MGLTYKNICDASSLFLMSVREALVLRNNNAQRATQSSLALGTERATNSLVYYLVVQK